MHISEGVLSGPVLASGAVLAMAGTAIGLKKIDYDRIVHVAILASAFFVASLIHVNVGPASVHLILNGIVGLLLGFAAIPAILTALLLQSVFFQYGGLTALGVNVVVMAAPAVLVHYLFLPLLGKSSTLTFVAGSNLFAVITSVKLLLTYVEPLPIARSFTVCTPTAYTVPKTYSVTLPMFLSIPSTFKM